MAPKLKRSGIPTWVKVAIIVPLCVFVYVAACGYFFGGSTNLVGTIVSWFMVVPFLTIFLSKIISGGKGLPLKSFISLGVFYGIMVFGIYKHYQSDFFKIMIVSFIFNSLAIYICYDSDTYDRNAAK